MKYSKKCLKEQLKQRKPINIFDIFKSYIKSSETFWPANFPMKKCVLSNGHKKNVQWENRVSNENCVNEVFARQLAQEGKTESARHIVEMTEMIAKSNNCLRSALNALD